MANSESHLPTVIISRKNLEITSNKSGEKLTDII
jgi:hypothetical protein